MSQVANCSRTSEKNHSAADRWPAGIRLRSVCVSVCRQYVRTVLVGFALFVTERLLEVAWLTAAKGPMFDRNDYKESWHDKGFREPTPCETTKITMDPKTWPWRDLKRQRAERQRQKNDKGCNKMITTRGKMTTKAWQETRIMHKDLRENVWNNKNWLQVPKTEHTQSRHDKNTQKYNQNDLRNDDSHQHGNIK